MQFTRESPFKILTRTWKTLLIILVPLISRIFLAPANTMTIIVSAGFNLLFLILLFVHYVLVWRNTGIGVESGTIDAERGYWFSRSKHMSVDEMVSLETEKTVFTALLGAFRVHIRSAAHSKKPDETFFINRKKLKALRKSFGFHFETSESIRFKASNKSTLIMALSGSNAAAGLLISIPFLRTIGSIVGRDTTGEVYAFLSERIQEILPFLDAATLMAATAFFLGWLVNFVDVVFRYSNFYSWRDSKYLFTRAGLLAQRSMQLAVDKIHVIDIRETLIMHIFGLSSVYLLAEGYEKHREQKIPLIPASTIKEQNRVLFQFFPYHSRSVANIHPSSRDRLKYVYPGIIAAAAAAFGGIVLTRILPVWARPISVLTALIMVFALWYIIIASMTSRRAGLKICSDCLIICGMRGLTMHTQKIPRGKLEAISITQNPFQQMKGLCNIQLCARGIRPKIICRHLPFEQVREAIRRVR
ncbi:MAG: PH domain-containing protein [Oscillospiraceae bacterium]|nr:PH domain-containing protein [Oscillospiraceae bacterium]